MDEEIGFHVEVTLDPELDRRVAALGQKGALLSLSRNAAIVDPGERPCPERTELSANLIEDQSSGS